MENNHHPYIITIGRQLGSGGKQLGELLSRQLAIPCYDRELILIASRESGLCRDVFERADEKNSYSFSGGSMFSFRSGFFGDGTYNCLGNESLFKIQSDIIRRLAEEKSCIFVGRCADYILREHPRLLRIFVSASMTDRVRRLATDMPLAGKAARTLAEQADRKRADYYNYYSNKTWGAATSYDICLNSSLLGMDEMAAFVSHVVSLKFGTEGAGQASTAPVSPDSAK
ncbi:MAG: cytidylate kinase-like family protein [Tannerella sp.]|jgi:cytidylate kinase|nr:cytidylate kinase-like family protein [Tannerella sp.]